MSFDVIGTRGTGNVASDQREVDFSKAIDLLEPEWGPLTILSKRAGKDSAISPKIQWFEDELAQRYDLVNGAQTNVDTTIEVDTGAAYRVDDLVLNSRSKELVRVTAVSGNNLTVIRGVGSTAAAMNDNDELIIIGSAAEEGADVLAPKSDNPAVVVNYLQIFRRSFAATETWRNSRSRHNPQDWPYQARKAGIEHRKDIELSLIHGKPSEVTTGTHPRRTTGGALHFIVTNVDDAGGALSEAEVNTHYRKVFRYGSRRRVSLGSGLAIGAINQFAQGKLETRQGDTTYGLHVMRYVTPFGTADLVTHWLLEGTTFGGYLVSLDMAEVVYRYLQNRDTKVLENRQGNGEDRRMDEFLSECGLQFGQEKRHGVIFGITG